MAFSGILKDMFKYHLVYHRIFDLPLNGSMNGIQWYTIGSFCWTLKWENSILL